MKWKIILSFIMSDTNLKEAGNLKIKKSNIFKLEFCRFLESGLRSTIRGRSAGSFPQQRLQVIWAFCFAWLLIRYVTWLKRLPKKYVSPKVSPCFLPYKERMKNTKNYFATCTCRAQRELTRAKVKPTYPSLSFLHRTNELNGQCFCCLWSDLLYRQL